MANPSQPVDLEETVEITDMQTENGAVAELAERLGGFEIATITDPNDPEKKVPVAVLPNGKKLESLNVYIELFRQWPERRKGRAALRTLGSLIDHAKRFKDENSVLFAVPSKENPKLECVIDYHLKGSPGTRARHLEHRGIYSFPVSEAWKKWTSVNNIEMATDEFASFIEDRLIDIIEPGGLKPESATLLLADKLGVKLATPAHMMKASRGLSIRVNHDVEQAVTLQTGEVSLRFTEKHEPTGNETVPAAFAINIPVFELDNPWTIAVRLRYRHVSGMIKWRCCLYRHDVTFDEAFTSACEKAAKETGLPLFYGTPE
jgi:uncharacterized protein YfdQ (DUF2303 family)